MNIDQLVVFTLDELQYALPLDVVQRIVHLVEITPLPKAPEIVLGIVNIQGQIIPVVNIRRRFRLTEREARLTDQLLIAQTSRINVALVVDSVSGVIQRRGLEIVDTEAIVSGIEYIEGVVKLEDGLILIHDINKFLSLEEEKKLHTALKNK